MTYLADLRHFATSNGNTKQRMTKFPLQLPGFRSGRRPRIDTLVSCNRASSYHCGSACNQKSTDAPAQRKRRPG